MQLTGPVGDERVSMFNGCRCIKDTRTVDQTTGQMGAELLLDGRWANGPLKKKPTRIPRRFKTALGVTWIKVILCPKSEKSSVPSSPTPTNNPSIEDLPAPASVPRMTDSWAVPLPSPRAELDSPWRALSEPSPPRTEEEDDAVSQLSTQSCPPTQYRWNTLESAMD